jgi:hypothetical protein
MSLENTQVVVLDDGRYAQVTFVPATRGRIRILSILVSEDGDESDEGSWSPVAASRFERDEMRYIVGQLDLSEVDLGFFIKG